MSGSAAFVLRRPKSQGKFWEPHREGRPICSGAGNVTAPCQDSHHSCAGLLILDRHSKYPFANRSPLVASSADPPCLSSAALVHCSDRALMPLALNCLAYMLMGCRGSPSLVEQRPLWMPSRHADSVHFMNELGPQVHMVERRLCRQTIYVCRDSC